MHSDAVADDRDDGPWLNDDFDGDGTGRDLLVLPAEEEAAAEELCLDGLGDGASRPAKRRSVDREITCVIMIGRGARERGARGRKRRFVNNLPQRAPSPSPPDRTSLSKSPLRPALHVGIHTFLQKRGFTTLVLTQFRGVGTTPAGKAMRAGTGATRASSHPPPSFGPASYEKPTAAKKLERTRGRDNETAD